jgi:hypothetical protein
MIIYLPDSPEGCFDEIYDIKISSAYKKNTG